LDLVNSTIYSKNFHVVNHNDTFESTLSSIESTKVS
jgi:hypothetical protein